MSNFLYPFGISKGSGYFTCSFLPNFTVPKPRGLIIIPVFPNGLNSILVPFAREVSKVMVQAG